MDVEPVDMGCGYASFKKYSETWNFFFDSRKVVNGVIHVPTK